MGLGQGDVVSRYSIEEDLYVIPKRLVCGCVKMDYKGITGVVGISDVYLTMEYGEKLILKGVRHV